jgi:hypothetical protein
MSPKLQKQPCGAAFLCARTESDLVFFLGDDQPTEAIPNSMARNDQPSFLGSPAFWNFVADQQADPVVRRLHEQVGSELQSQPLDSHDASTSFQAA